MIDAEAALPPLDGATGLHLAVDARTAEHTDAITHFVIERTSSPTRVASQHHNWLVPLAGEVRHAGLTATLGQVSGNDREVYLPSENRIREVYEGSNVVAVHDDSERRLEHALEMLMGDEYVARGSSNAMGLAAGTVFEVDHAISQFERLVALEVVHEISIDGDTLDVRGRYENHFVCVPASRFRAATTGHPRPVVHGPQTATVTGPAGQDIHTDRFGRIKILMHWDREGYGRGRERREDATSSVWVPVMQTWAGTGWGAVFVPRVGMKVVVDFLAGNPDRPVVVGCLYDARTCPPTRCPNSRPARPCAPRAPRTTGATTSFASRTRPNRRRSTSGPSATSTSWCSATTARGSRWTRPTTSGATAVGTSRVASGSPSMAIGA